MKILRKLSQGLSTITIMTASVLIAVCIMFAVCYNEWSNRYPLAGIITNVDSSDGEYRIEFKCSNGHHFVFYSEDGDWQENDSVAVIMNSRGTPKVFDDSIVQVRYAGHLD